MAPPGMFFCVAAHIVTFVATERCQPPTIARKMICGSPRSALRRCCPTRKRVLLFRTWSMSLWRRPDFPHETVATSTVLACVCVHTQTFGTSQHIKLSKSTKHFKGGHDLLLFFGVWLNMKMRVACLVARWSPGSEYFQAQTATKCSFVLASTCTHCSNAYTSEVMPTYTHASSTQFKAQSSALAVDHIPNRSLCVGHAC